MIVDANIEYITLRKVIAHYEVYIEDRFVDEFTNLSRSEQEEYIKDHGEILIDDFGVDDLGEITEINY